jgi:hypothetical protein
MPLALDNLTPCRPCHFANLRICSNGQFLSCKTTRRALNDQIVHSPTAIARVMAWVSVPATVLGVQGVLNVAVGLYGVVKPTEFFLSKLAIQMGSSIPRPAVYASRYDDAVAIIQTTKIM